MRRFVAALVLLATVAACGGGDDPSVAVASTTSTPSTTATPPTTSTPPTTGTTVAEEFRECAFQRYRPVTPPHQSADGAFTHAPFEPADINLITNGRETNDPRFAYVWARPGVAVKLYAPADMVLVRIRHKARNLPEFDSDDFDLFFLVDCDTLVRFNHVTAPRPDIRATYAHGDEPSVLFNDDNTHTELEDLQQPTENIVVRAGELIGETTGTPTGHNFDFQIAVDGATVCPFEVLEEPARTTLLDMLGPQSASPNGPPQPGYPCEGYGDAP